MRSSKQVEYSAVNSRATRADCGSIKETFISSMSGLFSNLPDGRNTSIEFLKAYRDQIRFEVEQRAQHRRAQLKEQSSNLNAPGARIRIWEKVHELRLPLDPMHPIVDIVAAATGLTLPEVREEQHARRATQVVTAEPAGVTV